MIIGRWNSDIERTIIAAVHAFVRDLPETAVWECALFVYLCNGYKRVCDNSYVVKQILKSTSSSSSLPPPSLSISLCRWLLPVEKHWGWVDPRTWIQVLRGTPSRTLKRSTLLSLVSPHQMVLSCKNPSGAKVVLGDCLCSMWMVWGPRRTVHLCHWQSRRIICAWTYVNGLPRPFAGVGGGQGAPPYF